MSDKIIKNKYECVFLLHAVGDTIGFKNSDWEFNYGKTDTTIETVLEFIFEFIEAGGINGISLDGWKVSDDTLYHIAIGNSLIQYTEFKENEFERFIKVVKQQLIDMHNLMFNEKEKGGFYRFPGIMTTRALNVITGDYDMRNENFIKSSGGNGAGMRSLCIGLLFNDKSQFKKLVDVSITLSKLTHNAPSGFLAGFTASYFVSLGIQEVEIEAWPNLLIQHLESDLIKKYINVENSDEFLDYITYVNMWKIYLETRFVDNKPLKTRATGNMIFRLKYYHENFAKNLKVGQIGSSGYCGLIMAYDALLDCDGKWEKLVFYSMLHPGDSDTVGAIAGGLYGAVYGYGDVGNNMLKHLEKKEILKKLGNDMFKKYHK